MRMEVHVHGTILLRAGTTPAQIDQALRPWLEYMDEDNIADTKSVHADEPGILFDRRRRVLEVCWTGDVGRSFHQIISDALAALNPLSEEAAAFEVSYYQDDGKDEFSLMFVGPTPESIFETQQRLMLEDLHNLLARQFSDAEIAEITGVVNQLFERQRAGGPAAAKSGASASGVVPMPPGRKHLH